MIGLFWVVVGLLRMVVGGVRFILGGVSGFILGGGGFILGGGGGWWCMVVGDGTVYNNPQHMQLTSRLITF